MLKTGISNKTFPNKSTVSTKWVEKKKKNRNFLINRHKISLRKMEATATVGLFLVIKWPIYCTLECVTQIDPLDCPVIQSHHLLSKVTIFLFFFFHQGIFFFMSFHCILCISTVLMHICRIYAHLSISFQLFFSFLMQYPKIHIQIDGWKHS